MGRPVLQADSSCVTAQCLPVLTTPRRRFWGFSTRPHEAVAAVAKVSVVGRRQRRALRWSADRNWSRRAACAGMSACHLTDDEGLSLANNAPRQFR
jgi:hypothetical protein